jgi:hypothetical protein
MNSGPSPRDVFHLVVTGEVEPLCGFCLEDNSEDGGVVLVGRDEQRRDDCAECWKIFRARFAEVEVGA